MNFTPGDEWDPRNPSNKEQTRVLRGELRERLLAWDPIGIAGATEAHEEYDCLLSPLLLRLHEEADADQVTDWLMAELRDHFGLEPSAGREHAFATEILAWWVATTSYKLPQEDFRAAIAPGLADLEREHPSLLRVVEAPEDRHLHAMAWYRAGSGTSIYLEHYEGSQLVAEAAGHVQDAAFEALYSEGKSSSWPSCPQHPDTHPLSPASREGLAVWLCPTTHEIMATIGALGRA
jgi:hypothetical protein